MVGTSVLRKYCDLGDGMWSIISGSGGAIFSSNSPTSNFSGIAALPIPCAGRFQEIPVLLQLMMWTSLLAPESDVRNAADNADITDGSTTISSALTDFEVSCHWRLASSTLRAENNGISNLTLGGTACYQNTTDFSITIPIWLNNVTIAPNGWELLPSSSTACFS
ncbi:MAG: hypothetical protein R2825_22570 [Saprospiraceae bacterium]